MTRERREIRSIRSGRGKILLVPEEPHADRGEAHLVGCDIARFEDRPKVTDQQPRIGGVTAGGLQLPAFDSIPFRSDHKGSCDFVGLVDKNIGQWK